MKPTIGRIVHYVSFGTPNGEYTSACRAAIITETAIDQEYPNTIGLAVMNPEGMFFKGNVPYRDIGANPGNPRCTDRYHGTTPTNYCPSCGWSRGTLEGGTWHWPERIDD